MQQRHAASSSLRQRNGNLSPHDLNRPVSTLVSIQAWALIRREFLNDLRHPQGSVKAERHDVKMRRARSLCLDEVRRSRPCRAEPQRDYAEPRGGLWTSIPVEGAPIFKKGSGTATGFVDYPVRGQGPPAVISPEPVNAPGFMA